MRRSSINKLSRRTALVLHVTMCLALISTAVADAQETALLFDGVDDIVSIAGQVGWPSSTPGLTIELWVKPSDVSGDSIIGVFWGSQTSTGLGLRLNNNSSMAWTVSLASTSSVYADGSMADGRWDHFAGTWDGTTMRIYHNGVLADEQDHPQSGSVGLGGDHFIGARSSGAPSFPGAVDEIRIWNVVRSEAEIATWMTRHLTGTEPGLIGYWRLDEGAGQAVLDATTYEVDGLLGLTAAVEPQDPQWTDQSAPLSFFFDGFESGDTSRWD